VEFSYSNKGRATLKPRDSYEPTVTFSFQFSTGHNVFDAVGLFPGRSNPDMFLAKGRTAAWRCPGVHQGGIAVRWDAWVALVGWIVFAPLYLRAVYREMLKDRGARLHEASRTTRWCHRAPRRAASGRATCSPFVPSDRLSPFAEAIYRQKYSMDGKEEWADTARRVATNVMAAGKSSTTKPLQIPNPPAFAGCDNESVRRDAPVARPRRRCCMHSVTRKDGR
jgi:hypothetical protein